MAFPPFDTSFVDRCSFAVVETAALRPRISGQGAEKPTTHINPNNKKSQQANERETTEARVD